MTRDISCSLHKHVGWSDDAGAAEVYSGLWDERSCKRFRQSTQETRGPL
jgi:hypothetical protein